ncbi:MAG TPA: ABC transporter permease [Caulobacteraceae bacterium]|nr:ABC transporter permease [Caulobacteraceae bacterium]
MNFTRVGAIVLRQLYLYRGSPQRVLPMFAWVAIDILLWGFITRYLNAVSHSGFNFVPALLGAVLLWDFLTRIMQGVTTAFFEDVWSRNFLNYFASPLRTPEYLTGLVITGVGSSFIALTAMLLLATGVFGFSFLGFGLALVPFVGVLFITGIALGILGAGIVLRLGPASEWLIWPIPSLLSPFAGVFYPITVLPGWMQVISKALPPAYVFEGMRGVVAGKPPDWGALVVGAGLALVYLLLAFACFAAIHRYAIRTGLIARYSAETVS